MKNMPPNAEVLRVTIDRTKCDEFLQLQTSHKNNFDKLQSNLFNREGMITL